MQALQRGALRNVERVFDDYAAHQISRDLGADQVLNSTSFII